MVDSFYLSGHSRYCEVCSKNGPEIDFIVINTTNATIINIEVKNSLRNDLSRGISQCYETTQIFKERFGVEKVYYLQENKDSKN